MTSFVLQAADSREGSRARPAALTCKPEPSSWPDGKCHLFFFSFFEMRKGVTRVPIVGEHVWHACIPPVPSVALTVRSHPIDVPDHVSCFQFQERRSVLWHVNVVGTGANAYTYIVCHTSSSLSPTLHLHLVGTPIWNRTKGRFCFLKCGNFGEYS